MILELTILAALGAMLCWGIGDFLIQKSVRKIGNIQSLAFIGVIGSVLLIPLIIKDFHLIFSLPNLFLLLSLSAITFIAAMFNFEALKEGKLSVIEVILEIELPITIALGIFFFGENLQVYEFALIAPIFLGIILMATKSSNPKNFFKKIEKGVIIGVAAAIAMGLTNFLTASASKQVSPIMAIWMPWIIFSLISLFVIIKNKQFSKFISNGRKFKTLIISMAILDTAAWVFYAIALFHHELSIITAITESYPAIALFLGIWINKERIRAHQFLGAILALVSSVVLALTI